MPTSPRAILLHTDQFFYTFLHTTVKSPLRSSPFIERQTDWMQFACSTDYGLPMKLFSTVFQIFGQIGQISRINFGIFSDKLQSPFWHSIFFPQKATWLREVTLITVHLGLSFEFHRAS